MRKVLAWIAVGGTLIAAYQLYGKHRVQPSLRPLVEQIATKSAPPETATTAPPESISPEARQAQQLVGYAGPLAQLALNEKPEKPEEPRSVPEVRGHEALPENRRTRRPHSGDSIARPVQTVNDVIVRATLEVDTNQIVTFEVPPHIVKPRLHGNYRSSVARLHGDSGGAANVDFLVLSENQYSDFLGGRPAEALFSVDASDNHTVNFDLPASMDQPVKYYLVFLSSKGKTKKLVEANFKVDF